MHFRRSASEIWRSLKTDFAEAYQRTEQRKNFAIIAIAAAAVTRSRSDNKSCSCQMGIHISEHRQHLRTRPCSTMVSADIDIGYHIYVHSRNALGCHLRYEMPTLSFSAGLIICAGIGNQTDRIFRGGVVDWLPAPALDGKLLKANIADLAAVAAIAVFAAAIVQINIGIHKNRKRAALPV